MGLIRAILRLVGLICLALAAVLGLFALVGYLLSDDTSGKVVAGVLGGLALLLLILGVRAVRHRGGAPGSRRRQRNVPPPLPSPILPHGREHTGLHYEDFRWGDTPPSRKQFGYAMVLGVVVQHGMTKWMLSDAIDEAIEQQRSAEPATKEQLRTIREYHGVLPRAITRGEARQVIEFLEEHTLPCPFCGVEIIATDDSCCACEKSLRKMKIPLKV